MSDLVYKFEPDESDDQYVAAVDLAGREGVLVVAKYGSDGTFTIEQTMPVRFDDRYEMAVARERQRAEAAAREVALADLWWGLELRAESPITRAVLDLHGPVFEGYQNTALCRGCDSDGWDSEDPEWPCRTVQVIAGAYGLEVPL